MWVKTALVAEGKLDSAATDEERAFLNGKLKACQYFLRWELPKTNLNFDRLAAVDDTWLTTDKAWL